MRRLAILALLAAGAAVAQSPPPSPPPSSPPVEQRAREGENQFAMGEAFRLGQGGMPINRDQAIAWYRKAAALGHTGARDALGILLFTKGERKTAIPLLQAAASRNDPRALYILGTAHFNGDAVPRDVALAYAEMKRAAAAGLPEAQRNLAKMQPFVAVEDRAKATTLLAGRTLSPGAPLPTAMAASPRTGIPPVSSLNPSSPPGQPPLPVSPVPVRPAQPLAVAAPAAAAIVAPVHQPSPIRPARPDIVTARTPPPAAAATVRAALASGKWRTQLGAYRSAAQAENQWAVLAGLVPGLARLPHAVISAGAFWRLQASGLAGKAAADDLCRRVVATGNACFTLAP